MPVFEQQGDNGLTVYLVDHPKAKALIARQGAHVLSYQPADKPEQLWVSDESEYAPGKAIRGGIPLCWPWFGKVRAPGHGFARISDWQLTHQHEDGQGVELRFALTSADISQQHRALFDCDFKLELQLEIGEQLTVSLVTHNTGSEPLSYSGALHSYFTAERDQLSVDGLGQHYSDSTQGGAECAEERFALSDETDRIYTRPARVTTLHRQAGEPEQDLRIEHSGHDSVVVWNAGQQLVASMADMHSGAEQEYLCIESAITQQPVTVLPGEYHTLSQRLIPA